MFLILCPTLFYAGHGRQSIRTSTAAVERARVSGRKLLPLPAATPNPNTKKTQKTTTNKQQQQQQQKQQQQQQTNKQTEQKTKQNHHQQQQQRRNRENKKKRKKRKLNQIERFNNGNIVTTFKRNTFVSQSQHQRIVLQWYHG